MQRTIPQKGTVQALQKKKRIRFTTGWDFLLPKAVTAVDGHRLQFGRLQATFQEALALFLGSAPPGCLNGIEKPSWKMLSDGFKKIGADHRTAVKHNAAASGIVEVRGERKVFLDDVVLGMDEWDEQISASLQRALKCVR